MDRSAKDIVIFTGAGISAAAGLRTYRGPNGLWNDSEIVKAADKRSLVTDPELVWRHWGELRAQIDCSQPTASHLAIARAQMRLPAGYSLHVVTQNVDGLHGRALGSGTLGPACSLIEFHGNVLQTRCSNEKCSLKPFEDHDPHFDKLPLCPKCGALLRPGIVLFGEAIDGGEGEGSKVQAASRLFKKAGTVIVVGTTLEVQPAAKIVDIKKRFYAGVETVWINVQPAGQVAYYFRKRMHGPADDFLPGLLENLVPG